MAQEADKTIRANNLMKGVSMHETEGAYPGLHFDNLGHIPGPSGERVC